MLTCLNVDDSRQLIKKITPNAFFSELFSAMVHASATGLQIFSTEKNDWYALSGQHHQLSCPIHTSSLPTSWMVLSDLPSLQPLMIAPMSWWEPVLQAVVSSTAVEKIPHAMVIQAPNVDLHWAVLVAVFALGVDEIFLPAFHVDWSSWKIWLEGLPVTLHWDKNHGNLTSVIDMSGVAGKHQAWPKSVIKPEHWYALASFLYKQSERWHIGHRVDFSSLMPVENNEWARILG